MFLGEFNAALFPLVAFTVGTGSIILCYVISQVMHHQKPFPDTWISSTARHYPEYIIFRIGTISGAVFIILSHVMAYFWVCQTAKDNAFNIRKYNSGIGTTLGIAGAMFLTASTALIDTGISNEHWHTFCAGSFFIFNIIAVWYHTVVSVILYIKAKAGGQISVILKVVVSLLILFQAFLETKASDKPFMHFNHNHLANILQYTLAFSLLGYFCIYAYDLRKFNMAYIYRK